MCLEILPEELICKYKYMKTNVIEYLRESVSKYPDKTAVADVTEKVTFSELYASAVGLFEAISSYGVRRTPIGVYIPKGCKAVEAFAGINLSGNFYVPLDTKSPHARGRSIIDVLNPELIEEITLPDGKVRGLFKKKLAPYTEEKYQ